MKFIGMSYSLYTKDIHQVWCRSAKFLWKSKFCSGSGSWFYFGFQYQTYISYIEDTHQISFGSANSFESYCVHMTSSHTYVQTDRKTDGIFFFLLCLLKHTKHEHLSKGEIFFFAHAITILSLFTYSVFDEKVKRKRRKSSPSLLFISDPRIQLIGLGSKFRPVKFRMTDVSYLKINERSNVERPILRE